VVFGSEVKALLASGRVAPAFSGRGLRQVFTAWAPVAPDTVFAGVEAVPPGCALRIDGRLGRHSQRYWGIDYESTSALSFSDAVEGLAECLDRAITLRLRADVPVGAYLSGGLDSSLITRRVHEIQGAGFSSFSIRFRDQRFDEGESQAIMTARLQSRHHEVWCGGPDIASALPDVVWHTEMPMLRTSPVPLFHLSGLVRDHSMKVVLTGEGADELLGGYNIFREARLREFCSRQPDSKARVALFQRLYSYVGAGDRRSPDFWRGFFGKGFRAVSDPYYSHRIRWANTAWSLRFLAPDLQGGEAEELESAFDARLPSGWADWPLLSRAQAVEMEGFMSGYLLAAQGDRVAMAHGVEVRYPFLDPDVVDFCLRLPATHRLRALSDKRVLRALAARELPPEIWDRPKQPYRAPIGPTLFGGEASDWIAGATDPAFLDSSGLFSESADKLFAKARKREGHMSGEREEMALVGMLTLGLLHKNFVEDFDSRAKTALDRFRARPDRPRHDWSAAAVEQTGEKAR
jgi:asparagine synthase (glutamine-hydrolysing)